MADLMGVTNPVPGYDGVGANRNLPINPNDTQIQNIPDPSRVGRPDARTDQQDSGTLSNPERLRYDSNFQSFLQRLQATPELLTALTGLLTRSQGTVVSSGLTEGVATELSRLLELVPTDSEQLLPFLTGQIKSGTRFGGALFTLLRHAYAGTQSEGLRGDILQFLKHYSDHSSTAHIEGNLLRGLKGIARFMPASYRGQQLELTAQLENSMAAGDRAGSLKLLQTKIFPFVSGYIERTHDMGAARGLMTLLTLDTARYESGGTEGLIESFHRLNGYTVLKEKLGGIDDDTLLRLLDDTDFARAAKTDSFADQLATAAKRALRGGGDGETQSAFREIVSALLVNESVYMPVNHFMIPVQLDDRLLFSELWVDPDAEGQSRQSGGDEADNTRRFLFKMDIQDLGLFDMVLTNRGQQVDLKIFCPPRVAPFAKEIETALTGILTDNGLTATSVQLSQMGKPLTLTEVFPKLFEGKNSINVKV